MIFPSKIKPRLLLVEKGYRPPQPRRTSLLPHGFVAFVSSPVLLAGVLGLFSLISVKALSRIFLSPVVVVQSVPRLREPVTPEQRLWPRVPIQPVLPPLPPLVAPLVPSSPSPSPRVTSVPSAIVLAAESVATLEVLGSLAEEEAQRREEARLTALAKERRADEDREAEARARLERERAAKKTQGQALAKAHRIEERKGLAAARAEQTETAHKAALSKKIASLPVLFHRTTPNYPTSARRAGLEGTTRILATIGVNGTVQSLQIISSSGHSVLDSSAVAAVKNWSFTPAKNALGQPVAYQIRIPVVFRIRT